MTAPNGNRDRRLVCLIGLVLASGTLACYWPARHFDYVNLDDPLYVYQTHIIQRGMTWPGVVWAFHSVKGGNWNPLVWLSHMADCQFYGLGADGHHLTNMLLHTANVLLLFLVLRGMTGAIWRSGFAAALFAWHPLHVESVVWISERKDVLSTLFWLLTMWAYWKYAGGSKGLSNGERGVQSAELGKGQRPKSRVFYSLALFTFALGLMCKPMLVTLPLVLLLLDYWPLARLESLRRRLLEKASFAVLSVAASILAVWAQNRSQSLGTESLALRLENVVVSYAAYLGKMFWPVKLAVFYPYPDSIPLWRAGGALLVLGAISCGVIWGVKHNRRYLGVGWLWYLGTLVPVIGLVQVGMQALADRYTYVPCIGLALMVSWGMADVVERRPRGRTAVAGLGALALGCCLAVTWAQVKYWRDSNALYEHTLKVTTDNYMAHDNLGNTLMDLGKLDEAVKQFQEVIRLTPTIGKPYNDLGKAYALQGKLDYAMPMFSNAIRLNPGLAEGHWNMGNAYLLKGRPAEGIAEMKKAARLNPEDIGTQKNLANNLIKLNRAAEALPYCEFVVREEPDNARVHYALATACLAAHRPERAVAEFKEALRLAPDTPECLNGLAWVYATCPKAEIRNGTEAVRLAQRACEISKRQRIPMLDTLAAAYAEAGRFADAVKTTEEFRALALSAHDNGMADTAQQRLVLYQAGKPYHDEP